MFSGAGAEERNYRSAGPHRTYSWRCHPVYAEFCLGVDPVFSALLTTKETSPFLKSFKSKSPPEMAGKNG